jgi:hypothetical protein
MKALIAYLLFGRHNNSKKNQPGAYIKKLGRGGKDRPPAIILRIDRNMVPAEKPSKPWSPITNESSPLPTLQRPNQKVARMISIPESGRGTTTGFFNQARNSSPRGIEPETWRCY